MGDVYLALDTKLNRKVAIKVLRPDSLVEEHLKKRLLREAQAAAKLDHPNICAVYDVNEVDSLTFIVMQYIEGETLAEKMEREPLPLSTALAEPGRLRKDWLKLTRTVFFTATSNPIT